jgi:hypothetical protein
MCVAILVFMIIVLSLVYYRQMGKFTNCQMIDNRLMESGNLPASNMLNELAIKYIHYQQNT